MRDDLLHYYERELTYLRAMGADFRSKYPKVASRLVLEDDKCDDPHVERLLEGFAFLAARVHLKLDDEFPEITESLFETIYPHYIRPLPSISLVEFHLDPEQGKLTTGFKIPRESMLYSRPVGGTPCKFRTTQNTTIWPVSVAAAQWTTPERIRPQIRSGEAVAALRLELRCFPDVSFDTLELDKLRFYLSGDGDLPYTLYELLLNNCRQIVVRGLDATARRPPILLPPTAITPGGFAEDEAILPYPARSFRPYRLLQEYFAFPQKFLFLDLAGFPEIRNNRFGPGIEVIFFVGSFEREDRHSRLEAGVRKETLRLNCSPIVNLFPQTSEPVLLNQRREDYRIVPDARRQLTTEIFSVDNVVAVTPGSPDTIPFEPLFAHRHAHYGDKAKTFWIGRRRMSGWRPDGGTDVFISFVDLSGRTLFPEQDAATCRLTCFNADLPSRLPFGSEHGHLQLEGGGPILRIVPIVKPTSVVQPPVGKALLWRLVSQLSLNYLSITQGGVDALREILRLHNFNDTLTVDRQIDGIVEVKDSSCLAQMISENGMSFVRGRRVDLEFDEESFTGAGVYLFANILERFLGLYVSMNSFTVTAARTRQRREQLKEWPPRAGNRVLL